MTAAQWWNRVDAHGQCEARTLPSAETSDVWAALMGADQRRWPEGASPVAPGAGAPTACGGACRDPAATGRTTPAVEGRSSGSPLPPTERKGGRIGRLFTVDKRPNERGAPPCTVPEPAVGDHDAEGIGPFHGRKLGERGVSGIGAGVSNVHASGSSSIRATMRVRSDPTGDPETPGACLGPGTPACLIDDMRRVETTQAGGKSASYLSGSFFLLPRGRLRGRPGPAALPLSPSPRRPATPGERRGCARRKSATSEPSSSTDSPTVHTSRRGWSGASAFENATTMSGAPPSGRVPDRAAPVTRASQASPATSNAISGPGRGPAESAATPRPRAGGGFLGAASPGLVTISGNRLSQPSRILSPGRRGGGGARRQERAGSCASEPSTGDRPHGSVALKSGHRGARAHRRRRTSRSSAPGSPSPSARPRRDTHGSVLPAPI